MKVGYFIVDKNGDLIGHKDTSKIDNAKWYQKLLARISKRYCNSLTMLVPIETGLETNNPDDWSQDGIIYTCEVNMTDKKGRPNSVTLNDNINDEFIKHKINDSKDKRWIIKAQPND